MDAYLPATPGLLLIHGGAWVKGSRQKRATTAVQLADAGIAAFPLDYRLAPDHPFPAALEDVQAAVALIRAYAARFQIDPEKLGALGSSAGGHLAALLATSGTGSNLSGLGIRIAVSWSGPALSVVGEVLAGAAMRGLWR
jgi:acetyl esterase/lipase